MALTREQLRKNFSVGRVTIEVDELGGEINLQQPDAEFLMKFYTSIEGYQDDKGEIDMQTLAAVDDGGLLMRSFRNLAAASCADDDGNPLFESGDDPILMRLTPGALMQICESVPVPKVEKKDSTNGNGKLRTLAD